MAIPPPGRPDSRKSGPAGQVVYAHPPLVESWLGMDFVPGIEWTDADSDALQSGLGPEWPGTWQELPSGSNRSIRQLTNVMGDRALRLKSDGFCFGWLGHGGERYPRYESVRDGFVAVLDRIRALADRSGTTAEPKHWSVRYVNRIPRGTVWTTPGDWAFFTLWQPIPLSGLRIDPSGFRGRWDLRLENDRGKLTIEFHHVPGDEQDEAENVWITLTASGRVGDSDASLFDGLDHGRDAIVRGFSELVSADAKTFWGVRPR